MIVFVCALYVAWMFGVVYSAVTCALAELSRRCAVAVKPVNTVVRPNNHIDEVVCQMPGGNNLVRETLFGMSENNNLKQSQNHPQTSKHSRNSLIGRSVLPSPGRTITPGVAQPIHLEKQLHR